MRTPSRLLIVVLSLITARTARGADAPATVDVVELTDGSKLTGSVVELKRGSYVIVEVDGKPTRLPWAKVKNVLRDQHPPAPPAPPTPASAAVPAFPEGAAAAAAAPDAVTLKSGQQIAGTVVQQQPGEFVIIRAVDGVTHTFNWSAIRDVRVTSVPPPAAPAPAPAPAAPEAATPAPATGETTVSLDHGLPSGVHYKSEVDCSKDPANDICKEQTKLDVTRGMVGASWTHEEVTRVKEPKNYSINFALDGQFQIGATTKTPGFVSEGGGMDLGVNFLVGTRMPGPEGGHFHGLGIQVQGAVTGGSGQETGGGGGGDGSSTTIALLTYSGGGNLGYQWLYFGGMDPVTLKQGGFGIFLGYHLGAQGTEVWTITSSPVTCTPAYAGYPSQCTGGNQTTHSSNVDFSQGPVLSFSFPKYNAGTAHLSQGYITFMALPMPDFFFATVSGGVAF